jgi:hypothetical protein
MEIVLIAQEDFSYINQFVSHNRLDVYHTMEKIVLNVKLPIL